MEPEPEDNGTKIRSGLQLALCFASCSAMLLCLIISSRGQRSVSNTFCDCHMREVLFRRQGCRADGIIRSMLAHSRAKPGPRRTAKLNTLLDEYVGLPGGDRHPIFRWMAPPR